jgi:hypothetical protein
MQDSAFHHIRRQGKVASKRDEQLEFKQDGTNLPESLVFLALSTACRAKHARHHMWQYANTETSSYLSDR